MQNHRARNFLNVVFFFSALALSLSVDSRELSFTGIALDPDTGALVYTEKHHVKLDDEGKYQSSSVRYIGPNGELYAVKELDFSVGLLAPALEFVDPRTDQRFSARPKMGELVLRTVEDGSEQVNLIEADLNSDLVVDAGFDQLLLSHWDQLMAGDEKAFQFLALTRGSTIEFELELLEKTDRLARFQIEPANWVISLLVDPIILDYDIEQRRLIRYEGLTNIAKVGADQNYTAVIEYRYDEDTPSLSNVQRKVPKS